MQEDKNSSTAEEIAIVCPYWEGRGQREVHCSWEALDTSIILRFKNEEQRRQQEKIFCSCRWEFCEIGQLLKVYDEEGD